MTLFCHSIAALEIRINRSTNQAFEDCIFPNITITLISSCFEHQSFNSFREINVPNFGGKSTSLTGFRSLPQSV
jgi:hypothetical protein